MYINTRRGLGDAPQGGACCPDCAKTGGSCGGGAVRLPIPQPTQGPWAGIQLDASIDYDYRVPQAGTLPPIHPPLPGWVYTLQNMEDRWAV